MSKSQEIIDCITDQPGLTADDIAERLDMNGSKTKALLTYLAGKKRIKGERFEGGGMRQKYTLMGVKPKTLHDIVANVSAAPPNPIVPAKASGKLTMLVIELNGADSNVVAAAFAAINQALQHKAVA